MSTKLPKELFPTDKDDNPVQPDSPLNAVPFGEAKYVFAKRLDAMAQAFRRVITEHSDGLPVASVMGVIEIVKVELLQAVGVVPKQLPATAIIPLDPAQLVASLNPDELREVQDLLGALVERSERGGKLDG